MKKVICILFMGLILCSCGSEDKSEVSSSNDKANNTNEVSKNNDTSIEETTTDDTTSDNTKEETTTSDNKVETTTKEEVVEEEIKYTTTTEKDSTKLTTYKQVKTKGSSGSKKIYYQVTYDFNGKEISREFVKEEIIKDAVNEVVVVGTKTLGKNEYIALKDNEVHKYTLAFSTQEECETHIKGENLGEDFPYGEKIYQILQCDEIKDINDKHYWGIYFIDSISRNTGFYY